MKTLRGCRAFSTGSGSSQTSLSGTGGGGDAGDGRLEACHGEGIGEGYNRADQLVDTDVFRAETAGEKNAVKKADDAADHACGGEQKSTA